MSVNQANTNLKRSRRLRGLLGVSACFLVFLSVCPEVRAQQEGNQLTQYMFNIYGFNSGFAGMSNGINASVLHRQQWLGWGKGADEKGVAPNSTIALIDLPIKQIKGGAGLEVASFNAAYFKDVYVKLGYTYHLQTSFGLIGMGVKAQIESKRLDVASLKGENGSDPALNAMEKDASAVYGDVCVGFYLTGNQNYTVGIGFNNLVAHTNSKLAYRPSRTMVVHGDYRFRFPSLPKVEFTPSTYLETDFHTVNWSIALTGTFNKRFWAGLSYRLQDAVSILAGVNIAKLQIGVSYDITASRLINASSIGGAFEVMVRYCFGLEGEKANTDYKNARYL